MSSKPPSAVALCSALALLACGPSPRPCDATQVDAMARWCSARVSVGDLTPEDCDALLDVICPAVSP